VWKREQLAVDPAKTPKVPGLFEPSHMKFEADRARDAAGEPSLAEMTAKALDLLEKAPKGYFLMVEGGRIDHGHHAETRIARSARRSSCRTAVRLRASAPNPRRR
jgi:alkaline phosphatase